jgi:hypothetical protein
MWNNAKVPTFFSVPLLYQLVNMPAATAPVDLVAVLAIKVVVVDEAGKHYSTESVSVAFSALC